jgi:hypothetical protein
VFLAGALAVPVSTFCLSGPHSTIASRQLLVVLWGLSFLACIAAPFFSSAPPGKKLGLAFLGLGGFIASLLVTWFLVFAVHGIPTG